MKKLFSSFLIFLTLASLALSFNSIALADPPPPAANPAEELPINQLDRALNRSGLENFAGRYHRLASTDPGADAITSVIFFTIDFLKYILGGLAVLFVIIAGIKLITAGKKIDEASEKQKDALKYIIYGLILVITADELVTRVFFGDYGECLASASNAQECATTGSGLVKGIYSLILAVLASVSVLMLVISAFKMVTAYGNEETINKEKKRITMSIAGLLIAAAGEFVVKGIIFRQAGQEKIDIVKLQQLIYTFINFIAAFIGAGAFVMMLYGGFMYVVSFGNEEKTGKAKKILIGAVIGLAIAFAAFAIVTTVTRLSPDRTPSGGPSGLPPVVLSPQ